MKRISIKWALDQSTGDPVFIEDAKNGLACNCRCQECGRVMIAEQSATKKRAWNFKHQEDSGDCSGGFETIIHKAAKKIIAQASEITIPSGTLAYTNPRLEFIIGEFRTDVSVTSGEFDVHFEIEVTNAVSQAKNSFYKANKYRSIKIDLGSVSRDVSPDKLKELILNSLEGKATIYWSDETKNDDSDSNPLGWILLGILAFFGLRELFKGRKRRR